MTDVLYTQDCIHPTEVGHKEIVLRLYMAMLTFAEKRIKARRNVMQKLKRGNARRLWLS